MPSRRHRSAPRARTTATPGRRPRPVPRRRRPPALAVVVPGLLAAACAADTGAGATGGDPAALMHADRRFAFQTDEAFDAAAIPAYAGDHADIYAHIDTNLDRHIAAIQRWIRQPSVSAQNIGITAMAGMLRDDLRALGFQEAELVPTRGHPGVWGWYDAGAPRTLLVYMMYDVQPVEPSEWRSPPFQAALVDHELGTVVMGRGATNQKGPQRALLNAIESIRAVRGTLPVNLMIVAEGEEELGSPNFGEIVDRYAARMRTADGVFFPANSQGRDGALRMSLGVKGILYTEIEAAGGPRGGPRDAEIHGSWKAIVDAPAWRLVQALASLTSVDGNTILVPGYYDGVRPPTLDEQRLINGMLRDWDDAAQQQAFAVDRWIDGLTGRDAILRYLYDPTLNINGMWSGYTEEGVKTILPHRATAKVDSRLPVGLHPDTALGRIRRHLDANGFDDIVIRKLSGYPAAQTELDSDLVRAALGVFNKWGARPSVSPRLAGSAPFYQFTERLGLPLVFSGLGHGSGAHAPNEYMVIRARDGSGIAGLAEIEKGYVDLLYALAEAAGR
jgi:acetylornithine deacetylase/succinyl-diaminopimelate desuccinylase-like protein